MSVYCTVQEAWGQNFGRRQLNSGTETAPNIKHNDANIIEGFADIDPMPNSERIFTKAGSRVYEPEDSYHHSSSAYRQFKASNQKQQGNFLNNVPKSFETNNSQGSDFYDFEDNKCPLGGSRIRKQSDIIGEPQFNDEMYPVYPGNTFNKKRVDCNPISNTNSNSGKINSGCDQSLCDDVTIHIMNCATCQNSVAKIVEKFKSQNTREQFKGENKKRNSRGEYDDHDNDDNENDESEEGSLDVTEIILFIICGIFFVFLLDSIVSIGKRFR